VRSILLSYEVRFASKVGEDATFSPELRNLSKVTGSDETSLGTSEAVLPPDHMYAVLEGFLTGFRRLTTFAT
jgi:hypothetical protein